MLAALGAAAAVGACSGDEPGVGPGTGPTGSDGEVAPVPETPPGPWIPAEWAAALPETGDGFPDEAAARGLDYVNVSG
ncbi:MAG: hypothetical protein O7B99_07335 [Planctomycetota bacterium]|nr:hypothetical protein [Planctomycetota bacterium]